MPFPVDRKFIDRAEQKLGILLPPSYITRMERSNGGAVAVSEDADDFWELFPIFDDSDKKRLKRTCNDVVRETRRHGKDGRAFRKRRSPLPMGEVAFLCFSRTTREIGFPTVCTGGITRRES
jgi:hypothetical protein